MRAFLVNCGLHMTDRHDERGRSGGGDAGAAKRVGGALRSLDYYAGRATPSKSNAKGKSKSRARHVGFDAVGDESLSPESLAHVVGKPLDSEQDAGWLWAHQYRCTISHSENIKIRLLVARYVRARGTLVHTYTVCSGAEPRVSRGRDGGGSEARRRLVMFDVGLDAVSGNGISTFGTWQTGVSGATA